MWAKVYPFIPVYRQVSQFISIFIFQELLLPLRQGLPLLLMIRLGLVTIFLVSFMFTVSAQCSICTKTAGQMGRESAEGLNLGILYLMAVPFLVAGYIGYRWWKQEKNS